MFPKEQVCEVFNSGEQQKQALELSSSVLRILVLKNGLSIAIEH